MNEFDDRTQLQSAYIFVKDSVADDLNSIQELKKALQYAGFNPSSVHLEKLWIKHNSQSMSFEDFCITANSLESVTPQRMHQIISDAFILSGDSILVKDMRNLLRVSSTSSDISNDDLECLINEAGEKDGFVKVKDLCSVMDNTITEIKTLSHKQLSNRSKIQRINSLTFTKKIPVNKNVLTCGSVDVSEWCCSSLKGSLYIDEHVISHQYLLEITYPTPALIKISPIKMNSTSLTADIFAFIFRELVDNSRKFIGYTSLFHEDDYNYWKGTLQEGKYIIIPYTTGCIKRRPIEFTTKVLNLIDKTESIELTPVCQMLLKEVFNQMDLDGNGLLSRQEFNLYNWRCSGEIVQDDEWEVVLKNFRVEKGELTFDGFVALHQMEAEDNGGDSDELWVSLESVGYNKYGLQDKSCPISITVFAQSCDAVLQVSGLKSGGILLDKAVIRSIMECGQPVLISELPHLLKYEFISNKRASIVIQNKSNESIRIKVDCSGSVNCFSNRGNLIWEGIVEKKSAILAHQLSPVNSMKDWTVKCNESVI